MSKQTRRILFYFSILAFIVGGLGVVFYAQGWRINFGTFEAEKVGGLYVRSRPANAEIFLDGEPLKNKSGFFDAGTLMNSLFPQTYTLRLSSPGYRDWERNVAVAPSLVTEVDPAVLVPAEADPMVTDGISAFWLLDDEDILVRSATGTLALQDQILPGSEVVGFARNFDRILTRDAKGYYWNDLRAATSTQLAPVFRRMNLRVATNTLLLVDPENNGQFLAFNPASLALADTVRETVNVLATTSATSTRSITAATVSRFWISWAVYDAKSSSSEIVVYDKFFGARRILPSIPGKTKELRWTDSNLLGFYQDDGEFYTYSPGGAPLHLASDVIGFSFTDDASMLALQGRTDLEIFDLRDPEEYWRIHLPQAQQITRLTWYRDNRHLFVSYPASTLFLELADRELKNLEEIAATDKVAYDAESNRFYFLEKDRLLRIEFPD